MDEKNSDPVPKKMKTKAEESDSEKEDDEENVVKEDYFWEYADIKDDGDLQRHLDVPIKKALKDRRYFLWVIEHALFEWFKHPNKFKAAAVSILSNESIQSFNADIFSCLLLDRVPTQQLLLM